MASAVLAETTLPLTVDLREDVEWINEFQYAPAVQQVRTTIDGANIVETVVNDTGQQMMLRCGWLDRQAVDELISIRDRNNQSNMTIILCDGRAYEVVLSHYLGPPVIINPHLIVPDYAPAEDRYADWYDIQLVFTILGSAIATYIPPLTIEPQFNEISLLTDIYLSCSVPGASIYYTLDGSDPDETDTLYVGPFNILSASPVKARAYFPGYFPSPILIKSYSVATVATPNILPVVGNIFDTTDISITCGTSGASIYYTVDGGDPTPADNLYVAPFNLSPWSATVRAKAFKAGYLDSGVDIQIYSIDPEFWVATPVINPPSGAIDTETDITIGCATPSSNIYYTIDGSDPDETDTLYVGPFNLPFGAAQAVRARAYRVGWYLSNIAQQTYDVVFPSLAPRLDTYDRLNQLELYNQDLRVAKVSGTSAWRTVRGTVSVTNGKYYFEMKRIYAGSDGMVGICNQKTNVETSHLAASNTAEYRGIGYLYNGDLYVNGSLSAAWGSAWTANNDVIGVAVDVFNGYVWFSFNGVWQAGGNPEAGTGAAGMMDGEFFPALSIYAVNNSLFYEFQFDSASWDYAAPIGFSQWPNEEIPSTYEQMNKNDHYGTYQLYDAYNRWVRHYGGSAWRSGRAVGAMSSGKRYFEVELLVIPANYAMIGVANKFAVLDNYFCSNANGWGYYFSTGQKYNGSSAACGATLTAGDVFQVAVDLDANSIWFGKNNVWQEGDPVAGTGASYTNLSQTVYPAIAVYQAGLELNILFSQSDWNYTPPTGFVEWQLVLEAPTITPSKNVILATDDISMSTSLSDASIYYTTDGSDPDDTDILYTTPINLAVSTTLKAIAYRYGYVTSEITEVYFEIGVEQPVTWNFYDFSPELSVRGNNLFVSKPSGGSANRTVRATRGITTGKHYFEVRKVKASSEGSVGVCNEFSNMENYVGAGPNSDGTRSIGYIWNGDLYLNGVQSAGWGTAYANEWDVVGVAVDADTGQVWFSLNGVWQASGNPAAGTNEAGIVFGTLYPALSIYYLTADKFYEGVFDSTDWSYAAPAGFSQWPGNPTQGTIEQFNKSDSSTSLAYDADNLLAVNDSGAAWRSGRCVCSNSTGKRYFEVDYVIFSGAAYIMVGVGNKNAILSNYFCSNTDGWGYYFSTGQKYHSSSAGCGVALIEGDIFQVAVDLDTGSIWFGINNVWQEGDPSAGTGASYTDLSGDIFPMAALYQPSNYLQFNFQQNSWNYEPPTGFGEWQMELIKPEVFPDYQILTATDDITIEVQIPGVDIYYTINGVDPTISDTLYTGPFNLAASCVLKAKAIQYGFEDSPVKTVNVTIDTEQAVTWNPLDHNAELSLSGGNLIVTKDSGAAGSRLIRATKSIKTGKHYFEVRKNVAADDGVVGACNEFIDTENHAGIGSNADSLRTVGFAWNGDLYLNGVQYVGWGSTWAALNDVVGVAVDADACKVWFSVNGVWQNSGDPANGLNEAGVIFGEIFPALSIYNTDGTKLYEGLFNSGSWVYAAPAGFTQWPGHTNQVTNQRMNPADSSSYFRFDAYQYKILHDLGSTWRSARALIGQSTGKRYFEVEFINRAANNIMAGVGNSSATLSNYFCVNSNGWGYFFQNGNKYNGSPLACGSSLTEGDFFMCAVDLDSGDIWFGKNGVWQEGDPSAGTGASYTGLSGTLYPMLGNYQSGNILKMRFQECHWKYNKPTGFGEW